MVAIFVRSFFDVLSCGQHFSTIGCCCPVTWKVHPQRSDLDQSKLFYVFVCTFSQLDLDLDQRCFEHNEFLATLFHGTLVTDFELASATRPDFDVTRFQLLRRALVGGGFGNWPSRTVRWPSWVHLSSARGPRLDRWWAVSLKLLFLLHLMRLDLGRRT